MQQATTEDRWTQDIRGELSFTAHIQLLHLQHVIANTPRDITTEDTFRWPCETSGNYTARSTYERLYQGLVRSSTATCIWRGWATLKCKIFARLAMLYRVWMFDSGARHGLQHAPSACYTCLHEEDNVDHILVQCVYAREVWHQCFLALQVNVEIRDGVDTFKEWWLKTRSPFR